MRFVKSLFVLAAFVAATISTELLVGHRAFRADKEQMLTVAAAQLEHVPRALGDWKMESESPLSRLALETLDCRGHVCRTYQNQKTGRTVSLVMLVGPSGPLVAHRPEVCMDGQGYRLVAGPMRVEFDQLGQASHELFQTTFAVGSAGRRVQVYYGWARGDRYEAPEYPRLTLGREPMLYKIQVSSIIDPRAEEVRDAGQQFVDDFLPVISRLSTQEVPPVSSQNQPERSHPLPPLSSRSSVERLISEPSMRQKLTQRHPQCVRTSAHG
jgi:hypothetical protein